MIRAASIMAAVLAARVAGAATAGATALPATRPFASPEIAGGPPAAAIGGLGEVTLALAVVLAAIFALAWVARRLRVVAGRGGPLAVLAEVRLGPKERAVLVKVGAAQLLVGVAQGQVNTLHVLAEPVDVTGGGARQITERPSFRAALLKSLGKS
ncbi:MAG TPA: flagellar biosynthetic protein FliO [Steroidobacteraceae bacterium]|nr:flagellar biosynthetic protein FliO [Steroidobacteraceae bacterium]